MREKFSALRARVDELAQEAGRDDHVDILLAVKTQPARTIREAIDAGGSLIGHNRAQELVATEPELAGTTHETHFIGMLQSNKVNQVLRHATCVQTVHTPRLADRLNRAAEIRERVLDVFVQVNTSGEESKFGLDPGDTLTFLEELSVYSSLEVRGLMTLALFSAETERVRECFRILRGLRDAARERQLIGPGELSMGMSGDFETAIEEGSTCVRVGQAIFGARRLPDSHYWPEKRTDYDGD